MQDKVNGETQEKSVGEVSDEHLQQPPADDRKAVRRRTFTRWINALLSNCDPPVEVHDLFTDIQDGRLLMALLEELTGYKLLYRFRSSSHRIFRLNNISKALAFLDDRHVKLLGIDASGIADGVPSVVLSLIWNIILHFQVKEVTGGPQRHLSSSLSSLSTSSPSSADFTPKLSGFSSQSCSNLQSKGRKATKKPKYHGKAIKTLLQWVQGCTLKFGVEVHDFGKSWRSGLAFLAMVKSIDPALVDLKESLTREPRENIHLAFSIAHHSLDIPPVLEPDDVLCSSPDEKSIITYVSMFLVHCAGEEEARKRDSDVPGIPNFGSLESVTFGDIHADDPEAKALLRGFERSSEHRLWRRWASRGSTRSTSLQLGGAVPPEFSSSCGDIFSSCQSRSISEQQAGGPTFVRKRSKCQSGFKPPSPLDAGIASPEICSWMERASTGQSYSKPRVDESRFSLSSEEGIYSLSTLDSDEEEAYNYILDLNKEDSQNYNQLKRKVPRVEEETAEEILNGETNQMEARKIGNGFKHQEGPPEQSDELEVRAQACCCGRDRKERRSTEKVNNSEGFDKEPEDRGEHEEDRDIRGKRNKDEDYEKESEEKTLEMERGPYEKSGQVDSKTDVDMREEEEDDNLRLSEDRQHGKLGAEKKEEKEHQPHVVNVESFKVEVNLKIIVDESLREIRETGAVTVNTEDEKSSRENVTVMGDSTSKDEDEVMTVMNVVEDVAADEKNGELRIKRRTLGTTTLDHPDGATSKNNINRGVQVPGDECCWTAAGCATPQSSSRGGGFILQSLAAPGGVTPLELEMLLLLWILIFCGFILQQIHL
ncbi:calmin-like isoform X1 [Xyrichtys novacula]|uniref:Calmin n=1 Tax=Xyrichtys novacula TaxID=13765 RepID=A0AAV1GXE1_XYRNO|nr:calmin-like isoform X1 [Xyrichtys novacula]